MSLLLRRALGLGLLGCWPLLATAQPTVPAADSVGRRAVARLEHRRFVALYDSRYSIINHHFTTINGIKAGVEFRNRFRTGGAIYFLSSGIPSRQPPPNNASDDVPAELRFRYLAGYAEYVLLETKRWELSGNLQLGLGSARLRYLDDSTGQFANTNPKFMGVMEPTIAGHYRIFRWGGIGAGVGWRQPIFVPGKIQRELNGPVFYARGKLFLSDLIKVVRFREKLFSQRWAQEE